MKPTSDFDFFGQPAGGSAFPTFGLPATMSDTPPTSFITPANFWPHLPETLKGTTPSVCEKQTKKLASLYKPSAGSNPLKVVYYSKCKLNDAKNKLFVVEGGPASLWVRFFSDKDRKVAQIIKADEIIGFDQGASDSVAKFLRVETLQGEFQFVLPETAGSSVPLTIAFLNKHFCFDRSFSVLERHVWLKNKSIIQVLIEKQGKPLHEGCFKTASRDLDMTKFLLSFEGAKPALEQCMSNIIRNLFKEHQEEATDSMPPPEPSAGDMLRFFLDMKYSIHHDLFLDMLLGSDIYDFKASLLALPQVTTCLLKLDYTRVDNASCIQDLIDHGADPNAKASTYPNFVMDRLRQDLKQKSYKTKIDVAQLFFILLKNGAAWNYKQTKSLISGITEDCLSSKSGAETRDLMLDRLNVLLPMIRVMTEIYFCLKNEDLFKRLFKSCSHQHSFLDLDTNAMKDARLFEHVTPKEQEQVEAILKTMQTKIMTCCLPDCKTSRYFAFTEADQNMVYNQNLCPIHHRILVPRHLDVLTAKFPITSFSQPPIDSPSSLISLPKDVVLLILNKVGPLRSHILSGTCQTLFQLHQSLIPTAPILIQTTNTTKHHKSLDYPVFGFTIQLASAGDRAGMFLRPESGKKSKPWLIVQDGKNRLIQKGNVFDSKDYGVGQYAIKHCSTATPGSGPLPTVDLSVDTYDHSGAPGRQLVWPVASNAYGMRRGQFFFLPIPSATRRHRRYYCFEESTKIPRWINDTQTEYCIVREIQVGDTVMAANGLPTVVQQVQTTVVDDFRPMVAVGDFLITPGHPVMHQGEWVRPDQIYPKQSVYVTTLYNFYCTPHHALVMGQTNTVCSSLGNYCPGLAEADPLSDALYGRGYGTEKAKRYEWLLSRSEQLPIHDLEAETNAYWAQENAGS